MAYFSKRVYGGRGVSRPMKRPRYYKTPTTRVRQFTRRTLRGPSRRGPLRNQVKSLQNVVTKLAPEIKYQETAVSLTNVTNAGAVVHLSGIAQGDSLTTRTGNSVSVVSLAVRGAFVGAADAPISGFARILIVMDKQQIADTDPSAGDVIDDTVFTANPVINLPSELNFGRFRILHSSKLYELKRMSLDSDSTVPPTQSWNFEYNWSGAIKVSYNGTAATDQQKNGIYFVLLTDSAANTLDFSGLSRIGFVDA